MRYNSVIKRKEVIEMTTMKSFRLEDSTIKNLEYLCKFFGCSQAELICYLVDLCANNLSHGLEEHEYSDLVKSVAFEMFGFEYKDKLQ